MIKRLFPLTVCCLVLSGGAVPAMGARALPPMAIGLGGVSPHTSAWQFVDMMKYSREWRTPKGTEIVEDQHGWPRVLKDAEGNELAISTERPVKMWIYKRRITGDIVLTWEGDGEVAIKRREAELITDEFPGKKRRVYRWDDASDGVFDLVVVRSNPADHVRNIRMWMPGFENAESPFHPLFKQRIAPFPFFRFMDWGRTNNSKQQEWSDRPGPHDMRQTGGVAYEYMIQLCNELDRDAWICVPHMASDDYVRQLATLIKDTLEPERKVWIEYSNEIWNPAFQQTRWIWKKAKAEGFAKAPWERGPVLIGQRMAQIWKIMEDVFGDPERLVRVNAHFRWLDETMEAATDPANGSGRVDVIALNGYFISQDALAYTLRSLDAFDIEKTMTDIEQLHLLDKAASWAREMRWAKDRWKLPIVCYEGGQHLANPFSSNLQGEQLVKRMFEINGHPRIRDIYRTALETWRLAGGTGFTAFVDCRSWSKYGCWGHLQYQDQPLKDVIDPATGEVSEPAAYKYLALMDYIERWSGQASASDLRVVTSTLDLPLPGHAYVNLLEAEGGTPPYSWSLLGGSLPKGLTVTEEGSVEGVPEEVTQRAFIVNVTDAAGAHASRVLGLFMSSIQPMSHMERFREESLEGWVFPGDGAVETVEVVTPSPSGTPVVRVQGMPYLEPSTDAETYTAEMVFTTSRELSIHARFGFALCMSPQGDTEDFLRVAVDGPGRKIQVYSRYVKGGEGELWGPTVCSLLTDDGEDETAAAFDPGEYWKIKVTRRPASSPGAIDLLVSVYDETGKSRLDPAGRNDVANGIWLMREMALKDALMSGPLGIMGRDILVDSVSWRLDE